MVSLEAAKHRWRTHTKKVLTDSFLNGFTAGEVWGSYDYGGTEYTAVVSPCGWCLICFGEDAYGNIFGFFPEDTKIPIDPSKWKSHSKTLQLKVQEEK